MCVCVYSNSRIDVPRVAQRYGTIAAHIRRRASVLIVFVVFCVHMYSFAGLIRRTPPPTFSDTAITDRHSKLIFILSVVKRQPVKLCIKFINNKFPLMLMSTSRKKEAKNLNIKFKCMLYRHKMKNRYETNIKFVQFI